MVKKPKLPRKISISTLNKMTGKQLKALRDKLSNNQSSLFKWGWTKRKLGSKSYIGHRVRLRILTNNVDSAIQRYWKSSKGYKERMRSIRKRKK